MRWLRDNAIGPAFIAPGSPWQTDKALIDKRELTTPRHQSSTAGRRCSRGPRRYAQSGNVRVRGSEIERGERAIDCFAIAIKLHRELPDAQFLFDEYF